MGEDMCICDSCGEGTSDYRSRNCDGCQGNICGSCQGEHWTNEEKTVCANTPQCIECSKYSDENSSMHWCDECEEWYCDDCDHDCPKPQPKPVTDEEVLAWALNYIGKTRSEVVFRIKASRKPVNEPPAKKQKI